MSKWYTLHIKNEILFWFLSLALLPLFTLTTLNYIYQKSQYQEASQEQLEMILNHKVKHLQMHIEQMSKEIQILSQTPNVKDAITLYEASFRNKIENNTSLIYEKYFSQIVNENDFYDLFLINHKGDVLYSVKKESDLFTNLKNGKYARSNLARAFNSSISLLDISISDFQFYAPSNKDAAFISIPVYGEEKILGVIAIQIDSEKIIEIFSSRDGLGESGEFYGAKLDQYGNIVATTKLNHRPNAYKEKFQFKQNTPIYKAVYGDRGSAITDDYLGNEVIATWAYLHTLHWGIVVKMDIDEILKPIENLQFYSIIILFFVALGIIIAIFTVIRHIIDPIEKLNIDVQNFAQGKMTQRTSIYIDNEIGELYRNFNDMASSLKSSQDTIQRYASDLEIKVEKRTNELKNAKDELEHSHQEMERFINIVDQYVITSSTDLKGKITKVSQAFCDITGYSKSELIGKKHNIIRHPDVDDSLYQEMWKTILSGKVWSNELKNQRKDGSYYWVKATITPIFDENGNVREYTSIRENISDKKRVEELSIRDQLTQLYNRFKLEEVFEAQLRRSQEDHESFSVILLDIDHFKAVNDTYGHDVGDETLKSFATILQHNVRQVDTVGRWGGEEFVIILPNCNLQSAMHVAEKIRQCILAYDFHIIGKKTSSFGVASYQTGDTPKSIIKRADNALYQAKNEGRNCVITQEATLESL